MNIRTARESDARSVARVHVETWRAAYRGVVPDAYLNSLSIDKRELAWGKSIRAGIPELWVAEIQSEVAGWVAFGPSRDSDASASVGELEAIYITPDHWATGVGRALWFVARRRLIERGFSSATLWVLVKNARAIKFYGAAGFQPNPASEKEINLGGATLKEVRYETYLGRSCTPARSSHKL
ncbi:MAG: GNAT family N-acetyltransferase [Pseudohongiellaceae bacterium]